MMMESDNFEFIEIEDMPNFMSFKTNEMEMLNFMALQVENVVATVLQKYKLYMYIQASNEIAEEIFSNVKKFSAYKRKTG